jgi:hypothetical protein
MLNFTFSIFGQSESLPNKSFSTDRELRMIHCADLVAYWYWRFYRRSDKLRRATQQDQLFS